MIIEIINSEEKINAFLLTLDSLMTSSLATLEKVKRLQYGPPAKS